MVLNGHLARTRARITAISCSSMPSSRDDSRLCAMTHYRFVPHTDTAQCPSHVYEHIAAAAAFTERQREAACEVAYIIRAP